jgi:urea transport system substrate-binding protein
VYALRHSVPPTAQGGPAHENQHTWKVFRLGKIVEGGQFEVIASSEEPIRHEPYAASRSHAAWNAFLADLRQRWDGLWANPGR